MARTPLGVLTLALFLGIRADTGSIRIAGVVRTAGVIGLAVSDPVQGRLLDRHSLARVIEGFAVANTACLLALAGAPTGSYPRWAVVLLDLSKGYCSLPALLHSP
ncbi:hypothetical protein ACFVS7_15565 [Streptomyces rubiginosohelvolus]|uniref:hypothetical protein n=1 Tax=Streptomyces rubiginosohelvolus TaxID=67362 RepID=UPI0036D98E44